MAFAEKDTIAPEFTFGGYIWNATLNENGEKIWTREDGKVNFEWVDDVYGGYHQYYMFVTRSEHVENKRQLAIYSDPRDSTFYPITGNPDVIDTFVGTTVAGLLVGKTAKDVLKDQNSTLIIVYGGIEHWPLGSSFGLKRQNLSYQDSNNQTVWQKIWGEKVNGNYGIIGPFVNTERKMVQCAIFESPNIWIEKSDFIKNPELWMDEVLKYLDTIPETSVLFSTSSISAVIRQGAGYDPEQSEVPTRLTNFDPSLLYPIITGEIVSTD